MILFIKSEKKAEVLSVLYDYAKHHIYSSFKFTDLDGLILTLKEANNIITESNSIVINDMTLLSIEQIKGVPLDLFFSENFEAIDTSGFDRIYGCGIGHALLAHNALLNQSELMKISWNIIQAMPDNEDTELNFSSDGRFLIGSPNKKIILNLVSKLSDIGWQVNIKNNYSYPFFNNNRLEVMLNLTPQEDTGNAISAYNPRMA